MKEILLGLVSIGIAAFCASRFMNLNPVLSVCGGLLIIIGYIYWSIESHNKRLKASNAQEKIRVGGFSQTLNGFSYTGDTDGFFSSKKSEDNGRDSHSNRANQNQSEKASFELLGLPQGPLSSKQLKQAYHRKLHECHPDTNPNISHNESVDRIKAIKQAKEVVSKHVV